MPVALNEDVAGRLDEVARILAEQGANRFRVQAHHQAAPVSRGLAGPVSDIFPPSGGETSTNPAQQDTRPLAMLSL
jgi:hypothetical protein